MVSEVDDGVVVPSGVDGDNNTFGIGGVSATSCAVGDGFGAGGREKCKKRDG